MIAWLRSLFAMKPQKRHYIRGTYAYIAGPGGGIGVDVDAYLRTPRGKEALRRIARITHIRD